MADIRFPNLAFAATGAPTARTMPTRLNDIINVVDWGADPTGGSDSTPAINAAIAYAYTLNPGNSSGTPVFVPPGTYLINTPPLVVSKTGGGSQQGNLDFFGAGRNATILKGNYAGYLVQRQSGSDDNLDVIRDMTIWNQSANSASGCFILFWSDNRLRFENLSFIGFSGLNTLSNNFGISIISCIATCVGSAPAGSVGIGSYQGEIIACQAIGFEKGFLTSATAGMVMRGCKARNCTYGFWNENAKNGAIYMGNWTQDCAVGFWLEGGAGINIVGNVIAGSGATGISIKTSQGGFFAANTIPMTTSNLSFDAKNQVSTQNNNVVMATRGPGGFAFPTSGYQNSAWEAIQCGDNAAPLVPWVVFGALSFNAYEGKEYNITDAQTQASFGGTITGGGSNNHYKTRFNNTNWIRVA